MLQARDLTYPRRAEAATSNARIYPTSGTLWNRDGVSPPLERPRVPDQLIHHEIDTSLKLGLEQLAVCTEQVAGFTEVHRVPDGHGVHLDEDHLQAFTGTHASMWGTRQPASRDRFAPKLGIDVIDGVLDDTSETVVVLGAQPAGSWACSVQGP